MKAEDKKINEKYSLLISFSKKKTNKPSRLFLSEQSYFCAFYIKGYQRKIRTERHLGRIGREGNDTPLQHSCLKNPMDGGAW